jgi:hypothetical protein
VLIILFDYRITVSQLLRGAKAGAAIAERAVTSSQRPQHHLIVA